MFFELCLCKLIIYLRYLRARGWKLPTISDRGRDADEDLALDILGPLLGSYNRQPLARIREYFSEKGIEDFSKFDPEGIADLFMILLRKHCRQELFWITGVENPEIAKLKRRFKDILSFPEYTIDPITPKNRNVISRAGIDSGDSSTREILSVDAIDRIVREAFSIAKNDVELCKTVFKLTPELTGEPAVFYYHELISALIRVRVEFAEDGLSSLSSPATPRDEFVLKSALQALETAVGSTSKTVCARFVERGRITKIEATNLSEACFNHFSELIETGMSNSLPQCFREAMPPQTHSSYLSKYKYILDSIVRNVRTQLQREFMNKSTNLEIGN